MLPQNLRALLIGTQAVGFATLVRSVAFDRWITVLASALLIVGAVAALRGRTWGVVLSFASAVAFPVAWAVGIAPMWFVFVGIIGALPFLLTSSALARVDRKATAVLAGLAATAGAIGAIAWKLFAWDVFAALPALRPSAFPQHAAAVFALLGVGMLAMLASSRTGRRDGLRVDTSETTRARIALDPGEAAIREAEAELEAEPEPRGESRSARRI